MRRCRREWVRWRKGAACFGGRQLLHHDVPLQRVPPGCVVVHDGVRVVLAQRHPCRLQLQRRSHPRCVEGLVGQLGQLRQVAADKTSVGVELLALADGVEDTEIGLRITAAGAGPLPATVVGRQVEVVQLLGKIVFAPAPVQPQIFTQETRHHHPQAVVHVPRLVDLRHGRVHQRVAGAALAPGLEQGVCPGAALPLDGVIGRLETAVHHMRVVRQDLEVEVAPDELTQPGAGARVALQHALVSH